MITRNRLSLPMLSALALLLVSCTEVAITGRKQLNLVPSSMVHSMSFQQYNEFLSENKLSTDAQNVQMVKRVGSRIQTAVERYCAANGLSELLSGYQWEFSLVENEAVNAWAMPGGKVVVYTGLLPVAENETGLAVVMGHEIAHAIARHGNERMSQGLLLELGGMALSEALEKQPARTQQLFMQSYGIGTELGLVLPYSRLQETEADRLGLIFMAMAGYDPHAAVDFWQRMVASKSGAQVPEFLSTHPADNRRIRDIRSFVPEAMQYYDAS